MAFRSSGKPEVGVYFVQPSDAACAAASQTQVAVPKSGSPTLSEMRPSLDMLWSSLRNRAKPMPAILSTR